MAMEVTTSARGRLRLSLDTLVLAMAMLDMVLEATMAMEAITLARGRLRLSLATLVLALATLAMVLEATMAMEAITLARGRLRLSLDTLVLAMAMEAMVLAMLATEGTTSASKLSSRLLPSSAAIRSKQDCEEKCPSTFSNVQMLLYFSKFNLVF